MNSKKKNKNKKKERKRHVNEIKYFVTSFMLKNSSLFVKNK